MQSYDIYAIYELMITPSNKKGEMIIEEINKLEQKLEPNLNIVRDLITLGANLDWQDEDGSTALHRCAGRSNSPEIARMLIDAGADLNIQDNYGRTALHYCGRYDHSEIARMLINAGADMNILNNDGQLPYEFINIQYLEKLLQP